MNAGTGSPSPDDAWRRAASLAARLHASQRRKDGQTPYVAHPVRVALTIRHIFHCDDEAAIAAALLHDAIEDTTADYDEIAAHAGPDVADIVAAMTKNMLLPETQRERDYDQRLASADWRARLVKLADVLDNLLDSEALDEAGRQRMLDRCQRALTLAKDDEGSSFERARRALAEGLKTIGP